MTIEAHSIRPRARAHGWFVAVAISAGAPVALASTHAHAGPSDNSASKPWSLHAGLGPAVSFGGDVMGRLQFDMEYHFKGGDVGPALGFYVPVNFERRELGLNVGPIFVWDFRIAEAGGGKIYVGPLVASGYGFHAHFRHRFNYHFWFFHAGGQFRMLWNDNIGFFARPANFEVWAGNVVVGHWSFVGGLAAAF